MKIGKMWAAAMAGMVLALGSAGAARADNDKLQPVDKMFVMKTAQGNLAEIMTGQLALKKSKNDDVRMVANMIIKGHSAANMQLKGVAMMHKARTPADTDRKHKAMYRKLSRMSGMSFDREYMKGQVKDHNMTIAMFKKYMEDGKDSHVREFAAKTLPDIENHTKMIHNVASNIGIPVSK